jgi:excisionase family DNA binding protein
LEDTFLTVAEIAELLRLNQQTVRNWIDAGNLAAVRVGRRVRVRESDLDRFIAAGETAPALQKQDAGSADASNDPAAELRQHVRDAIAEASAALEGDDDRLAGSLDSLVKAARGLKEELEREPSG